MSRLSMSQLKHIARVAVCLPLALHAQYAQGQSVTGSPAGTVPDQPATASVPSTTPGAAPSDVTSTGSSSTGADITNEKNSGASVRFTPYAWLTAFNGSTGVAGVTFDVDASFSDVLETSDSIFGLMGAVDLEINRFVFQINGTYSQAEVSTERGRASNRENVEAEVDIDSTLSNTWLESFAGYRLVERPIDENRSFAVDAFAGLRYTHIGIDVGAVSNVTLTLPNGQVLEAGNRGEVEGDEDWIEPFIGSRLIMQLSERWQLGIRGDVGGFGVDDSSFSWQVIPTIGYLWEFEGGNIGLFGGYRALGQDYESDGFVWDVVTHGPILGLSVQFDF